jgi:hypothetical protein
MLSGRKAMNRIDQFLVFDVCLMAFISPVFFFSLVDFNENDAATFNHSILFRVFCGESFCSKNHDGYCASNQSI